MVKKYFIMITAALAAFFMTLFKAFRFGQKIEQQKQIQKDLEAAKNRLEVENEINQKQDSAIRNALRYWMRKP